MLSTGFTEQEFEEEIDRREEALKTIENNIDRHARKYKQFLRQTVDERDDRKIRYLRKAKEQQIKHEMKNEIYDTLIRQQLLLVKLLLHGRKQRMLEAGQTWDFEIDIDDLPMGDIIEDVETSHNRSRIIQTVIEEIDKTVDIDSTDTLDIDLSEIEAEAEKLEVADIADQTLEAHSPLENELDERIREELARLNGVADTSEK